jgi:hypothetical protein
MPAARWVRQLAVLVVLTMSPPARAGAQAPPPGPGEPAVAVRSDDWRIQAALAAGADASGAFRSLLTALARSDLIVHIEDGRCRVLRPEGCTLIVGKAGRTRYLRIRLSTWRPLPDLLQLLAHELQHAVEIANAPDVIDEDSLAALYRRIGERRIEGVYETEEAVNMGDLVLHEYQESLRAR